MKLKAFLNETTVLERPTMLLPFAKRSLVKVNTFSCTSEKKMHNFMLERINTIRTHGLQLTQKQSSAVLEHSNATWYNPLSEEVTFIDQGPYWCTRKVKEAIHIRLHPEKINRDSAIEIPEACVHMIKQHNIHSV